MKCPVCDVELKIAERQGVEIDYCPNCRGVWLDRGELDKLIERSRSQRDWAERDDDHSSRMQSRAEPRDYRSLDTRDRDRDWDRRMRDDDYDKRRKKRRSFFEEIFDFD